MNRAYRTDAERRAEVKLRHDTLRDLGKCILGPMDGYVSRLGRVHGPAYLGGRCFLCREDRKPAHQRVAA